MGFLDNLENNLKNLESREQAEDERAAEQRQNQREQARAAAPWAEKLKQSPYIVVLLSQATRLGHARRTKVHIAWLGNTLRLEARERKLELRPTPSGVVAVILENNREVRTMPVDLESDPGPLASALLAA